MIVEIVRATCDFLESQNISKSYGDRTEIVRSPCGSRTMLPTMDLQATMTAFNNSALKATIHRTMGKKCPKNLTATVRFYGDRTGTVRIWRFSHRTASVTPNRNICDDWTQPRVAIKPLDIVCWRP